jgi:hypothetical protein
MVGQYYDRTYMVLQDHSTQHSSFCVPIKLGGLDSTLLVLIWSIGTTEFNIAVSECQYMHIIRPVKPYSMIQDLCMVLENYRICQGSAMVGHYFTSSYVVLQDYLI